MTTSVQSADIQLIQRILPHRYPFLLVDKVVEINGFQSALGIKNVTMNEPQFTGHFPGNPVMPGVLQIEAMAQTGGIFSLSKVEEPHLYSTYFMKIDNVKFKKKVIPGDTIVFELKLISPIIEGSAISKFPFFKNFNIFNLIIVINLRYLNEL